MTIETANSEANKTFNKLLSNLVSLPPSEHYSFELRLNSLTTHSAPLTIITPHGIRLTFTPFNGDYLNMNIHITDTYRRNVWEFTISSKPKANSTVATDGGLPLLYNMLRHIPTDKNITRSLSRISVVNMLDKLIPDLVKQTPIRRF